MKYAVLLGDGMADEPIEDLGGKTPLEAAHTPNMDHVAAAGILGLIDTIPPGFTPGSDVANLSVLGYDPRTCYTGRGAIEAANMGLRMNDGDVAFRCNLVTLGGPGRSVMEDFTAGHITTDEARRIIDDLQEILGSERGSFHPGVGYRHLYLWRGGRDDLQTTPPHDITGQSIAPHLPSGEGSREILDLMRKAAAILQDHPVNVGRRAELRPVANGIWLWGQGRAPKFEKLTETYRITGGMISAVDLLNGMGVYAGLDIVRVPGATGYIDTDYDAKAEHALEVLRSHDFVFVHVEAPDEMGHEGNVAGKIRAIEDFDAKIVGPVLRGLAALGAFRLMVLSDHPTPIRTRTHSGDPSPFAVLSSIDAENRAGPRPYGETAAKATGLLVSPGHMLMASFIGDWRGFIDRPIR